MCVSGNMVAVDDVDGMKSSVETYRTCTDKENSELLYAKITKKKSARYNMLTASKTRHFLTVGPLRYGVFTLAETEA